MSDSLFSPIPPFPNLGGTSTTITPVPSCIEVGLTTPTTQTLAAVAEINGSGFSTLGGSSVTTVTTTDQQDQLRENINRSQEGPDWRTWNEFQSFRSRWHAQNQDTPDLAAFRQQHLQHHSQSSGATAQTASEPPLIPTESQPPPGLLQPWIGHPFSSLPNPFMFHNSSPMFPPPPLQAPAQVYPQGTNQLLQQQLASHPLPSYAQPPCPFPSYAEGINYQYRRASLSPFIAEIEQYQLPPGTRLPTMRSYDGTTDPDDHIENYRWMMKAHYLDPRFWCTYFVTTLSGAARSWFKSLSSCTIKDFDHLEEEFLANFIQQRKFVYDPQALLGCRQRSDETIQMYFNRFNKATLQAPGRADSMIVAAFTYGLKEGPLFRKLVGKPSKTRKELMERVSRYLRQEEAIVEKSRIEHGSRHSKVGNNFDRTEFNNGNNKGGRNRNHTPGGRFQPFNRDRHRFTHRQAETLAIADSKSVRDARSADKVPARNKPKFCEYHSSNTHYTAECSVLRKEIDNSLHSGQLNSYI